MGLFSWECAVTGESIASIHAGKDPEMSKCYLVTPYETYYEEAYQGYGVFDGNDVFELLGHGDRKEGVAQEFRGVAPFDIKVVLAKNYEGQTYNELEASQDCPAQGFFYEEDNEEGVVKFSPGEREQWITFCVRIAEEIGEHTPREHFEDMNDTQLDAEADWYYELSGK